MGERRARNGHRRSSAGAASGAGRGRRQRETTTAHAGASTSSYSGNSSLDEFFSSRSSDASFASAGANTFSKDRQQKHRRAEEADVGTIADATILGRRYTRSGAASGTAKSPSRRTMPRVLIILLGCVALSILTNRRTTKKASKQTKNKAGYNIYKDPFFGYSPPVENGVVGLSFFNLCCVVDP